MIRILKHILLGTIALLCISSGKAPVTSERNIEQLTALYLYNFTFFVDWPEGALSEENVIRIAVSGNSNIAEQLFLLQGKQVNGRDLVVTSLESIEDSGRSCHVIYLDRSLAPYIPQFIKKVEGRAILTISNMKGFTQAGGMVWFKNLGCMGNETGRGKRFEINLAAVERVGLKIRSRLLRLSDVVSFQSHGGMK